MVGEDYWAAGWLIDLEFHLWASIRGDEAGLRGTEAAQLRYLSSKCNGWVAWQEATSWGRYVPLADWEREYDSWRSQL